MEVDEDSARDLADRLLRDFGEHGVAQLLETEGSASSEAITEEHPDWDSHYGVAGRHCAHCEAINNSFEEEGDLNVDHFGRDKKSNGREHWQLRLPPIWSFGPEMPSESRNHFLRGDCSLRFLILLFLFR
jgi:hypothetical protein